ncbi:TRAP transporter small permease subunit [bacterium]|nr:TRAP transporter small permease subunit [bacterium]
MNQKRSPGWLRWLVLMEQWLLAVALGLIVLLAFLQIILRNGFDTAIYWIDPFTRHLALVLMFIGGARAADRLSHLRIDLLSPYLPAGWKQAVNRLSWLGAATVSLVLGWAGYRFVLQAYQWGDGSVLTRLMLWFIPVGFCLMAFHFAVGIVWPEPEERA